MSELSDFPETERAHVFKENQSFHTKCELLLHDRASSKVFKEDIALVIMIQIKTDGKWIIINKYREPDRDWDVYTW